MAGKASCRRDDTSAARMGAGSDWNATCDGFTVTAKCPPARNTAVRFSKDQGNSAATTQCGFRLCSAR
jgi:hypothetical protein